GSTGGTTATLLKGGGTFTQRCAPKFLCVDWVVRVAMYCTQPGGRMRSPYQLPSWRKNSPNRAQSRGLAYMNEDPIRPPDASDSMTAWRMPMRSNNARRGNFK